MHLSQKHVKTVLFAGAGLGLPQNRHLGRTLHECCGNVICNLYSALLDRLIKGCVSLTLRIALSSYLYRWIMEDKDSNDFDGGLDMPFAAQFLYYLNVAGVVSRDQNQFSCLPKSCSAKRNSFCSSVIAVDVFSTGGQFMYLSCNWGQNVFEI